MHASYSTGSFAGVRYSMMQKMRNDRKPFAAKRMMFGTK